MWTKFGPPYIYNCPSPPLTFIIMFTCLTSGSPSWPLRGKMLWKCPQAGGWELQVGGWVPPLLKKTFFCVPAGSFFLTCLPGYLFVCLPVPPFACWLGLFAWQLGPSFAYQSWPWAQSALKRPVQKKDLVSTWKKTGPKEGLSCTSTKEGPGLLWYVVVWKIW